MPRRHLDAGRHQWRPCSKVILAIVWWCFVLKCSARDVVVCSNADQIAYAAQSTLFDFEEHTLRMTWFVSARLTPLPDSGGCDIVRLPSYEATSYILRGVDLQIHTLRLQVRNFFHLVTHPRIISPHMLDGETIAVPGATEMHVFLLQAIKVLSLTYREISGQELLEGILIPNNETLTIVLCDDLTEVDTLFESNLVSAKITWVADITSTPHKVLFTSEDLYRWGHSFSYVMVTTRKWAQDPTNVRILRYFTAVTEVYDAHCALQPYGASSPEIDYLVKKRLGIIGYPIVGGEIVGVPLIVQKVFGHVLSESLPSYYFIQSGEKFWEARMNLMFDRTIVRELAANSELFYTNGWSPRQVGEAEFDNRMDLRVYDGLEEVIQNVTRSFDWTPGQSPGVQRPRLPLGAWDNWPPPEQARYCSGTVELPSNASGWFSDGHMKKGSYAPSSICNWILPQLQTQSGEDTLGPRPVLVEFPLLFLEPMSEQDTVQVVDPRAPHRLLAHFRGQVVGGAVRHAGPLEVRFRSYNIRRLNTMELEMGFNAEYSYLGCQDDPRGCHEGTCGDDGVCVCPEGRSGVDCSLEHCLGTNVYELQAEESVVLRSNVAVAYPPVSDCRWEVHPLADCATCVVDVVFTSLQTELGHDAVQVATAPSREPFWWDRPPNGTVVHSRSDLDASGLRVRGKPGMAVFVRLHSDEVVEGAGFEATARVLDSAQAPEGVSTSNCYDAQGGQACSGRGTCAPGVVEGELERCVCDTGYFGSTCREEVCDLVNVAPTLPTWRLRLQMHDNGKPWIARNSECRWAVAPAPLSGNGSKTLPASSLRVTLKDWNFEGTRNNELILAADKRKVTLKTNRCISGQECALDAQCFSQEGAVIGACDWSGDDDTLEMPPQFTLTVRSGLNSLQPQVAIVLQATFMTPSGHMVVAEEAEPTALVCEPKPGQTRTSLVFDYEALDCLPPPAVAPPELREESGNSLFFVIVLVPILAVLFLVAAVLTYRNRLLSRHLYDMRTKGMKLDPQAFNIDLDSPLTKVTKYLGSIAGNRHFLLRMLFPKTELAKQAEALQAMLVEADNVHRPKLDTDQLQAEYGQDIVDFLLVSTCARRYPGDEVQVDPRRAAVMMHGTKSNSDSDGGSANRNASAASSDGLLDFSNEMLEEERALLEDAGSSYDVDLSRVYTLKLKGALCFVTIKVMDNWDLIKSLKISRSKMASYLLAVEDGYMDNPYHNVYHATDVTNRLATMFTKSGLAEHLCNTHNGRVQLLGVVLAAAVHDYGHPGTNNAYAIKKGLLYAIIYNDQAVYENSALYQALALTDNPELDYAARFSEETKRLLRVTVIDLVLSTDMSRHFDIVTLVKSKVGSVVAKASARQGASVLASLPIRLANRRETETDHQHAVGIDLQDTTPDQIHLIMQFALKVADIGHCMLPLDQHKFWVGNLETEFFNQGDMEKESKLTISPLMDRTKPGPTNGSNQMLFPDSGDQLYQQTESNLRFWRLMAHPERKDDDEVLTFRHRSFSTLASNDPTVLRVRSMSGRFNSQHTIDSVDCEIMAGLNSNEHIQRSVSAYEEDVNSTSTRFDAYRKNNNVSFKSFAAHGAE